MQEELVLTFLGDLCPTGSIEQLLTAQKYDQVFGMTSEMINDSDYSIANLECPVTMQNSKISKVGPNLRAHPSVIPGILRSGINTLALANNHIMDYGTPGLEETLQLCRENNILTFGANKDITSASEPLRIRKNNISVSILNVCEHEFSIAQTNSAGAAPIDYYENLKTIRQEKKSSDKVIVLVHGGTEHFHFPNPFIQKLFRFYAEAGADIVIGHHTHVFSGFETYHESLLFYGLGNFIFDMKHQTTKNPDIGIAVKLHISESVRYEIIPFRHRHNETGLMLLEGEDKNIFFETLENMNTTIRDEVALQKQWEAFALSRERDYVSRLKANSTLHKRIIKHFKLYKLSSAEQLLYLKHYFSCQSHTETLKTIFTQKNKQ